MSRLSLEVLGDVKRSNKKNDFYSCPFCGDTKDHLGVWRSRGIFHCLRCNASGRIKDLHYDLKNFEDLVKQKLCGSAFTDQHKAVVELPREYQPITKANNFPYQYLKKRSIYDSEIKHYKLGFCPSGLYGQRIIIPIYQNNKLVYFIGRTYLNATPKYMNSPAPRANLVFSTFQEKVKKAVIVEGVFDAIRVAKLTPAIALLGKVLNSKTQVAVIRSLTDQAIVLLDSDAWKDGFEVYRLLRNHLPTKLVLLQDKDPGATSISKLKEVLSEDL